MSVQNVEQLICQFFSVTHELDRLFPKRSFSPDGHIIESFCEIWAAKRFDLELLPASSKIHNARTRDKSILVQIKSTQGETVVLRSDQVPQHLLVMKLSDAGVPDLIFNGPGVLAYSTSGKQPSNGQRTVRLKTLRKIQIPLLEQLPRKDAE